MNPSITRITMADVDLLTTFFLFNVEYISDYPKDFTF